MLQLAHVPMEDIALGSLGSGLWTTLERHARVSKNAKPTEPKSMGQSAVCRTLRDTFSLNKSAGEHQASGYSLTQWVYVLWLCFQEGWQW